MQKPIKVSKGRTLQGNQLQGPCPPSAYDPGREATHRLHLQALHG